MVRHGGEDDERPHDRVGDEHASPSLRQGQGAMEPTQQRRQCPNEPSEQSCRRYSHGDILQGQGGIHEQVSSPDEVGSVGIEDGTPMEHRDDYRVVRAAHQEKQNAVHHEGPDAGPRLRIWDDREE